MSDVHSQLRHRGSNRFAEKLRIHQEDKKTAGCMTFITGLSWEEAKARCPEGVVPACHNSIDTVTVSGPAEAITKFVAELKEEGIFAKEVQSAGVAFHSYYMNQAAPALKAELLKVRFGKLVSFRRTRVEVGCVKSAPHSPSHRFLPVPGDQDAAAAHGALGELVGAGVALARGPRALLLRRVPRQQPAESRPLPGGAAGRLWREMSVAAAAFYSVGFLQSRSLGSSPW